MRTSFHHQSEAQHPKSSAIHKSPADYPIFGSKADVASSITHVCFVAISELHGFCQHLLSALQGDLLHRTSSILIPDGHGPLLVAYLSVM